jgi:hypothetical protein
MAIKYFRKNLKTHVFTTLTTLMVVHPMTANASTYEKTIVLDNAALAISVNISTDEGIIVITSGESYDEGFEREEYDLNSPEHVKAYSWNETIPGDVVETARKLIGKPYVFAASHPRNGFDCSGLVKFVYGSAHKIYLPHSATQQTILGKKISPEEAQPGDLVAYADGNGYGHIGIYSGDGKIIHSTRSQGGVRETSVDRVAGAKTYVRVTVKPAD